MSKYGNFYLIGEDTAAGTVSLDIITRHGPIEVFNGVPVDGDSYTNDDIDMVVLVDENGRMKLNIAVSGDCEVEEENWNGVIFHTVRMKN